MIYVMLSILVFVFGISCSAENVEKSNRTTVTYEPAENEEVSRDASEDAIEEGQDAAGDGEDLTAGKDSEDYEPVAAKLAESNSLKAGLQQLEDAINELEDSSIYSKYRYGRFKGYMSFDAKTLLEKDCDKMKYSEMLEKLKLKHMDLSSAALSK